MVDGSKIGLALGSGGARGFAHIGVLKVLEAENIKIDFISGSSMGALVGAIYAAGVDIERIIQFATVFQSRNIFDFTPPKTGLIEGRRIKELITLLTHRKRIEELEIPLSIVAANLHTGKPVIFKEGSIADAVRASISVPGIFVPEEIDGQLLVDGGIVDRVPISLVKSMGANKIIAVDVSQINEKLPIDNISDVIVQSLDILQLELVKKQAMDADIILEPDVAHFSPHTFTKISDIIKVGEEIALEHLDEIKALLK